MERPITWYEVLGVLPSAEADKIRRKYDERTALLRAELIAGAPSNVLTAVDRARNFLDTAWEVLGDPASRKRYDETVGFHRKGLAPSGSFAMTRARSLIAYPSHRLSSQGLPLKSVGRPGP